MNKHTFLVSDESVNANGFKVLTQGIDLTAFIQNPIMLYMHERPHIIGRWENIEKKDDKLYADAVFDIEDEKGKEIARKVEAGFLKGASLGLSYNEKDLQDDTLLKSVVHEISIVDIGSNQNALKLYNKTSFIDLYFQDIKENQTIAKELNLKEPTQENILLAIANLKQEHASLLQFQNHTRECQKKESEALIQLAINRKVLPAHLVETQAEQFKNDYEKTKIQLLTGIANSYPLQTTIYSALVKPILEERKKGLIKDAPKSKADWTLDHYRRYAPDELEQNPTLYKELVNKKFN